VGPHTKSVGSPSLDKDVWLPAGLPSTDVAGSRDDSWNHIFFIWLCLVPKPSHVRADVDGLGCFLHHPTVYDWQMWVQSSLTRAAMSRCVAVVGGAFLGDARPSGLDIYHGVDHSGT
jgi:hypothetical protein